MKKTVSLVLAAFMIFAVLPVLAFAETQGEGALYWGITEAEDLIISSSAGDTDSCTIKGSFSGNEEWTAEERPWNSYAKDVRNVHIKGMVAPTSTCSWFSGFNNCGSMDLSGLDTSNVTNMSYMFLASNGPTTLDLSCLDTTNVTDMSYMFAHCTRLGSLDISSFNTANVTDMSNMFEFCWGLKTLDISNFDTSKVTNMREMFYLCMGLKTLNLSSFDTTNVTDMSYMFKDCQRLTEIDLSSFNTANVTDMSNMFNQCCDLTTLDLSGFDTTNVTNMSYMFDNCRDLTVLDVSNFNTANAADMSNMFAWCKKLTVLDVSDFDTANVTNMSNMFDSCEVLTALDVSGFDTANVTDMRGMFASCGNLAAIDAAGFDTANVTDMSDMFYRCSQLTAIDLSGFDTADVTNMHGMFFLCEGLTALDLSSFDMHSVTDAVDMLGQMSKQLVLTISETVADKLNQIDFSMDNALYRLANGCGNPPTEYAYNYDGWHYTGLTAGVYYTDKDNIPTEHRYSESWASDDSGHRRLCTNCGARTEEGPHSYNNDQTVCDICGYTRKPAQTVPAAGSGSSKSHHSVAAVQSVKEETVNSSNTASKPALTRLADVDPDDWYYESVQQVCEQGLFYGTSDSTFSPQETMTRGMLAAVLHRLAGTPETLATDQFRDVTADKYYAEAVAWAVENDIALGYGDGSFGAEESITREQVAVMLYNYAGHPETTGTLVGFADAGQAGEFAGTALCWAVEQGIITGKDGSILDPKGTATRAEVAAMLVAYSAGEK